MLGVFILKAAGVGLHVLVVRVRSNGFVLCIHSKCPKIVRNCTTCDNKTVMRGKRFLTKTTSKMKEAAATSCRMYRERPGTKSCHTIRSTSS